MRFFFFSHFQWLTAMENGGTSMCRGRSELIRPSLNKVIAEERLTIFIHYRKYIRRAPFHQGRALFFLWRRARALEVMFSTVKPNFSKSVFAGAEAPNRSMPTASPSMPT